MKIVFITTRSITFNTFLKSQADYLGKNNFNVEVACSDNKNLNFNYNLTHKIDFPNKISELFNLFNYIKIFKQIRHLIKKNSQSIFYLHTPVASHIFRLFTFFHNLKIVYFVHGFRFMPASNSLKDFFFKIVEKILSFNTAIFITINNDDFIYSKLYLCKKSNSFKINGVGLDLSKKYFNKKIKKKKNIKKVIVIAAYKKNKGYLEILKLAEILKKNKIQIKCYGYGDQRKFNSIKIKKKLNNIFFYNFDKKLKNKIKKFDILLHLSKREGLPVAVMESLLEGLPVICYNIRGNNDLIIDGINGLFVKSYIDAAKKISFLNLEESYFNKLRYNAFKSINNDYSKKEINKKLFKIFKSYNKICNSVYR